MTDQNVTVQELAQARAELDKARKTNNTAEALFELVSEKLSEYRTMQETSGVEEIALMKVANLETKFKAQLIAEYKGSGAEKKKQFDGGSVAVGKKFFYDDTAVIAWLRDHNFGNLITETYKKTDVKPMHKENNPVDGITTEETITPKINTDLSEFLEVQDE